MFEGHLSRTRPIMFWKKDILGHPILKTWSPLLLKSVAVGSISMCSCPTSKKIV